MQDVYTHENRKAGGPVVRWFKIILYCVGSAAVCHPGDDWTITIIHVQACWLGLLIRVVLPLWAV